MLSDKKTRLKLRNPMMKSSGTRRVAPVRLKTEHGDVHKQHVLLVDDECTYCGKPGSDGLERLWHKACWRESKRRLVSGLCRKCGKRQSGAGVYWCAVCGVTATYGGYQDCFH